MLWFLRRTSTGWTTMRPDAVTTSALQRLPQGIIALRFYDILEELRSFRLLVAEKLAPQSDRVLAQLEDSLLHISASDTRKKTWCTPPSREIVTLTNNGRHQRGRLGHGRSLRGEVSFIWEVEPLGTVTKKTQTTRYFALHNSSVTTKLIDECAGEVARWNFDVGTHDSPGCHFHYRSSETDASRRELICDVDVPRVPSLIFMPTDAFEFILGELWQIEWAQTAASSTNEMNAWRHFSRNRWLNVLRWYLRIVENGVGSPLADLKSAKPEAGLVSGSGH
jgi:hypothetical protein